MKKLPFIFLILLTSLSTASLKPSLLHHAEWLIGIWENHTPRGIIYESWVKMNAHELRGKSYVLKEGDTLVFETIRLIEERDSLFYIPTVSGQNNGLPVPFAMAYISDSSLVFENPLHDFPQRIAYSRVGTDSLVAEISGERNGEWRSQSFAMVRQ